MRKPRRNADLRMRQAERDDDAIRRTVEFMRAGGQLTPDSVHMYPPGSWREESEGEAHFPLSSEVRVTVFWERLGTDMLEVHVQGEWWWRPYPGRSQRHYTPDLSVDVPMDDLARLSWMSPRPWLRPEVQSLIYEMLTEILPRWRGSHGEPLKPTARENPDLPLRELYRALMRQPTNRQRWLDLIRAAHRAGFGLSFTQGRSFVTGVEEDGALEFDGQVPGLLMRHILNIGSPTTAVGLELAPFPPGYTPPAPNPPKDEFTRREEEAARLRALLTSGARELPAPAPSSYCWHPRERIIDSRWHAANCGCPCRVCDLDRADLAALCRHERRGTPTDAFLQQLGDEVCLDCGVILPKRYGERYVQRNRVVLRNMDERMRRAEREGEVGYLKERLRGGVPPGETCWWEEWPPGTYCKRPAQQPSGGGWYCAEHASPLQHVQPNMDERLRDLERRAAAGDTEARLRFLYEQFRAHPWLETWLAWKLEEANQQVWAKNREWSPDCDPCGEVNVDRVRYSFEHAIATRTPHIRVDGSPTKPSYPRQKVRRRYEGARTVVLGRAAREDGWHGIAHEGKQNPDWLIVVAPYLGRHATQHGLHIHDVFPDMPELLPQLMPGGKDTTIPWLLSRPDHYLATEEEVRRFIAPVSMRYWTEGAGAEHEADVCDRCGQQVTHIDVGFCPSLQGMGCPCGGAWRPFFGPQGNPDERMRALERAAALGDQEAAAALAAMQRRTLSTPEAAVAVGAWSALADMGEAGFEAALQSWLRSVQGMINEYFRRNYSNVQPPTLTIDRAGKRFLRIVKTEPGMRDYRSVYAFVDRTGGPIQGKQHQRGDVLKAAGWRGPAKHARGNLFDESNGVKYMGPHGPAYLKNPEDA